METKSRVYEARQELKGYSAQVKKLVEKGKFATINDAIRQTIYQEQGHTDLRTFDQWKEAGFYIKKGSKGLPLWSEPQPTPADAEGNFSAFRVVYCFSAEMVYQPKDKQQEAA